MNRTVTFGLLISLLSTSVSAAKPTLGERHAALEASLTTNQRNRSLGKNFVRVGGLGFAVAALTAGAGVGVAATTIALTPYVVLAGFEAPQPTTDDTATVLLTTGLIVGVVSAVLVASGAVVLGTTASAREVQALEHAKLVLEYQQGVERRDAMVALKARLAEPTVPPTLLPEASPAAPHLRGPLRPGAEPAQRGAEERGPADAPTR